MCLGSDRPDGQTVHTRAGFPVCGVGAAVGGVNEAVGDEKKGGNGVEGTFNKDMTNHEMTLEAHKQIVKHLRKTYIHIWRARACAARKKCASVRTVRCCLYTPPRVHGSCHCLDAKLPGRTINLGNAKDYKWSPDSGEFDETSFTLSVVLDGRAVRGKHPHPSLLS